MRSWLFHHWLDTQAQMRHSRNERQLIRLPQIIGDLVYDSGGNVSASS